MRRCANITNRDGRLGSRVEPDAEFVTERKEQKLNKYRKRAAGSENETRERAIKKRDG
jgi:formylmethanofuran dehydrogenase subunit E